MENLEILRGAEQFDATNYNSEPKADCTRLDTHDMDCLERGDKNPCPACRAWDEWNATNARDLNTLNEQILLAMHKACLQADYLRQTGGSL